VHLLEHLDRGGERLGEDGRFVGDAVGDAVQVGERQRQELGVRALPTDDSQHRPVLAVGGPPRAARLARAAGDVDVADNPLPDPLGIGRRDDLAHELVADDARVGVVAARELDVGPADTGQVDADERLALGRRRFDLADGQDAVLEPQRLHGSLLSTFAVVAQAGGVPALPAGLLWLPYP